MKRSIEYYRILSNKIKLILLLFTAHCSLLPALDFGLNLNQYIGYGNFSWEDNVLDYSGSLVPRLSGLIGNESSFFASAGVTLGYKDELYVVPELLRTELLFRFGPSQLKAGRINYIAPYSYIVQGLFDGLQFSNISNAGQFGIGVYYAGLQYKKSAHITMTDEEQQLFDAPLDYGSFADTYFAPRRLIAALDWEHPAIAELLRLKVSLLGQFDFTKNKNKYHSQYIILYAGLPVKSFLLEVGGSVSTVQSQDFESSVSAAFSADLGLSYMLPSSFNSRIALNGIYTSGKNNNLVPFNPVTVKYSGSIFQSKMTALSVIGLNYMARFTDIIGTDISVSYFLQNDLETGNYPAVEGKNNYALGAEFFARLVISPASDLQFILGGGAFVPALGNVIPKEYVQWRVDLTAVLALY